MASPSIAEFRAVDRRLVCRDLLGTTDHSSKSAGFTLLEAIVVISLIFIACCLAIITGNTVLRAVHLRQSSVSYSNLLQQARIRAVRDDRFYSVRITPATETSPAMAFVDIAGSGMYSAGDPLMLFAGDVTPSPSIRGQP